MSEGHSPEGHFPPETDGVSQPAANKAEITHSAAKL